MLQPRLGPIKREAGKQEVNTGGFLARLVKIWLARGPELARKVQYPVAAVHVFMNGLPMDASADLGA